MKLSSCIRHHDRYHDSMQCRYVVKEAILELGEIVPFPLFKTLMQKSFKTSYIREVNLDQQYELSPISASKHQPKF